MPELRKLHGVQLRDTRDDALTRAVRDAASALESLAPHASGLGQEIPESIRRAVENLDTALAKEEIVLAIVGEANVTRALLRMFLGEAIRGTKSKRERVVRLRAGATFDYAAKKKDGSVIRFARSAPDRDPIYKKAIDDAESKVREAEAARAALVRSVEEKRAFVRAAEEDIARANEALEEMGHRFAEAWRAHRAAEGRTSAIARAEPDLPAMFKANPAWWAFWIWVWRWIVAGRWRDERAAYAQNRAELAAATERVVELERNAKTVEQAREDGKTQRDEETAKLARAHDALANGEVALSEECAVSAAKATVESLVRERQKHAGERREEFFSDLGEIDSSARGDDIDALDIELPKSAAISIAPGVALAFDPQRDVGAVDGYVLVRDPLDKLERDATLRDKLPRALSFAMRDALKNEIAPALTRVSEAKHRVVAAKFGLAIRACIANVERAREAAEVEHQRRLGALESQRIPHPAAFRAKQIARSESAIEKGADDVLATALAHVHEKILELKTSWIDRISSSARKRELDDAIREINQRGKLHVLELLEATSERIAREMQSVGETLERWALDEIQTSYRVQKRVRAESLAPVASEVTGEDLAVAVPASAPLAGARETFQRTRLRISTACALALGAVSGVSGYFVSHHALVRAGLAAVLGLILGSFAGRFKKIDSLRTDCLARATGYVDAIDEKVATLLRTKRGAIAEGIRAALDDALGETLERLNDAITRLMTIEKNAIEAERSALANLDATRGTLAEHDSRLASALKE